MSTAFVLSGGGSLGAIQVGMLVALAEHGVTPDYVVPASIGAINAAWVAGRPGLDGARALAEIWRNVHRRDVFPSNPLTGIGGLLGQPNHLVPPHALRRLVERHLEFRNLEDAPIPIGVVSTDVNSGTETLLTKGSTIDALIASASIPGGVPTVDDRRAAPRGRRCDQQRTYLPRGAVGRHHGVRATHRVFLRIETGRQERLGSRSAGNELARPAAAR